MGVSVEAALPTMERRRRSRRKRVWVNLTTVEATAAYAAPINSALKVAIRSYYAGICQYCGDDSANHVEHIIALSKGGSDILGNVTLSCKKCNLRKMTIDLDPMFVAIAHARAREFAAQILSMTKIGKSNREGKRKQSGASVSTNLGNKGKCIFADYKEFDLGQLCLYQEENLCAGHIGTSNVGHTRLPRKPQWPTDQSVQRGGNSSRDLHIYFRFYVESEILEFRYAKAFDRIINWPLPYERLVAERYLRMFRRQIVMKIKKCLPAMRYYAQRRTAG